jgi:hypothetical protein
MRDRSDRTPQLRGRLYTHFVHHLGAMRPDRALGDAEEACDLPGVKRSVAPRSEIFSAVSCPPCASMIVWQLEIDVFKPVIGAQPHDIALVANAVI